MWLYQSYFPLLSLEFLLSQRNQEELAVNFGFTLIPIRLLLVKIG